MFLTAALFTVNVSNAEIIRQYNGKVVDGECRFPLNRRKKIVDKELLNVKHTHTLLDVNADDYEFTMLVKDRNTGKKETKTVRFCRLEK
jgi:hypothetical protein